MMVVASFTKIAWSHIYFCSPGLKKEWSWVPYFKFITKLWILLYLTTIVVSKYHNMAHLCHDGAGLNKNIGVGEVKRAWHKLPFSHVTYQLCIQNTFSLYCIQEWHQTYLHYSLTQTKYWYLYDKLWFKNKTFSNTECNSCNAE